MDPSSAPHPQHFVATSQGLSATRWFSFVLASHPDVFVAHGHHGLDSILRGNFDQEKQASKTDSLTFGTQLNSFYAHKSLPDVFRAYRAIMPQARALGCVHAYTLERLVSKAAAANLDFQTLPVINIIRHPVHYIASHQALVGLAREHQLPIYDDHYEGVMFQQAIAQFPELTLFANIGTPEFISFVVSCLSLCNQADDFVYTPFKHVQMEQLTTDVSCLKGVCEYLTGLEYPLENIEAFVQRGAINLHQKRAERDPKAVYEGWEIWQQDIAHMMVPTDLLDRFEAAGYEVGMLRLEPGQSPLSALAAQSSSGFSPSPQENIWLLQFQLKEAQATLEKAHQEEFNLRVRIQQLEAALPQYAYPSPTLVEDFDAYNILAWKEHFYGLPKALGPVNLASMPLSEGDGVIVGISLEDVKHGIHAYLDTLDKLAERLHYQAELAATQAQLSATQADLGSTQSELERSHTTLGNTQQHLEQVQAKVKTLQGRLKEVQAELKKFKDAFQRSQDTIQAMESSKFWKLRDRWLRFKQLLSK